MRTFWPACRRGRAHATTMSHALAWAARSGSTVATVAVAVRSSASPCCLPCAWTCRPATRARRTRNGTAPLQPASQLQRQRASCSQSFCVSVLWHGSSATAQGVAAPQARSSGSVSSREGADSAARACGGRERASARAAASAGPRRRSRAVQAVQPVSAPRARRRRPRARRPLRRAQRRLRRQPGRQPGRV